MSFEEAKRLTDEKCDHEEHQEKKRNMIISMIEEMEEFARDEKKWRASQTAEEVAEAKSSEEQSE